MATASAPLLFALLSSLIPFSLCQTTVSTCGALNQAIERVNAGQQIKVVQIAAKSTIDVSSCAGMTAISKSMSIVGLGTPPPVITGKGYVSIFNLDYDSPKKINITLTNLLIKEGNFDNGGCLFLPSPNHGAIISNVTFLACKAVFGGAIYSTGGPLILMSVSFVSNVALQQGGAINVNSGITLVRISYSNFTSNIVFSSDNAYGGAIFSYANLVISNTTFSSNSASSSYNIASGGAISSDSDVGSISVSNSTFQNNFAYSRDSTPFGGAISFPSLDIRQSTFLGNYVSCPSFSSGCGGSSTSSSRASIISSTFSNNFAKASGATGVSGAVSCAYCTITSSIFYNNSISSVSAMGGAITSSETLSVTSSTFSYNSIKVSGQYAVGGAISSSGGNSVISKSRFLSNSISALGSVTTDPQLLAGGAVYSSSSVISTSNTFSNNSVTHTGRRYQIGTYGGALCSSGLSVSSSSFSSNSLNNQAWRSAGGAISAFSQQLSIFSSSFSSNFAVSGCAFPCIDDEYQIGENGGGALFGSGPFSITFSNFTQNYHRSSGTSSTSNGGAIMILLEEFYDIHNTISSSLFSNNSCTSNLGYANGGAMFIKDSSYSGNFIDTRISSSRFFNNFAIGRSSNGGAIYYFGYNITSYNSSYTRNLVNSTSGNSNGGALAIASSGESIQILFSQFQENGASSNTTGYARGGAIFLDEFSYSEPFTIKIAYSNFLTNFASAKVESRGGSLFINTQQYAIISKSNFSSSSVSGSRAYGGSIYSADSSSLSFCNKNTFSSNTIILAGKTPRLNSLDVGSESDVRFCPYIPIQIDPTSSFQPQLTCDACDCDYYFNPCSPEATCNRIEGSSSSFTFCSCPSNLTGNGFSCGVTNACFG